MCSTEPVSGLEWNHLDTNEVTLLSVCNSLLAEIAKVHLGERGGGLDGRISSNSYHIGYLDICCLLAFLIFVLFFLMQKSLLMFLTLLS